MVYRDSPDWLREILKDIRTDAQRVRADFMGVHRELRQTVDAGFESLERRLDAHAVEDSAVAARVLVMETERKVEAALGVKRSTWAGILAAMGFSAGLEVLKVWFRRG